MSKPSEPVSGGNSALSYMLYTVYLDPEPPRSLTTNPNGSEDAPRGNETEVSHARRNPTHSTKRKNAKAGHATARHDTTRPGLSLVEHLLQRLPPRGLAGLAALGAGDQALLELIRHLPPLADLWVLAHPLHVARVVVADVFEGGEEDVRLVVVEYAVCGQREKKEEVLVLVRTNEKGRMSLCMFGIL